MACSAESGDGEIGGHAGNRDLSCTSPDNVR